MLLIFVVQADGDAAPFLDIDLLAGGDGEAWRLDPHALEKGEHLRPHGVRCAVVGKTLGVGPFMDGLLISAGKTKSHTPRADAGQCRAVCY